MSLSLPLLLVLTRLWLGTDDTEIEILINLAVRNSGFLRHYVYTADIVVDDKTFETLLDTSSTGLVIARNNALRKVTSCKMNPNVCTLEFGSGPNFFTLCYDDGTGYAVLPNSNRKLTFGKLQSAVVTIGDAIGVYDPAKRMLSKSHGYVNTWGLGGHGGKDCSFSSSDAFSDLLRTNSLPRIWSLRSVSSTLEARMYLGKHLGSHAHTGLIERDGRYIISLSGLAASAVGSSRTESHETFSALEFVLDTGASRCVRACACVSLCV